VTAENHSLLGGLSGTVAEGLGDRSPVSLKLVGVRDAFGESGALEALFEKHGLTTGAVVAAVDDVLGQKAGSRTGWSGAAICRGPSLA
jgi:transketolase